MFRTIGEKVFAGLITAIAVVGGFSCYYTPGNDYVGDVSGSILAAVCSWIILIVIMKFVFFWLKLGRAISNWSDRQIDPETPRYYNK